MKKILVPIDFSKQSEYAIKLAEVIAKKTAAEVHLLHMMALLTWELEVILAFQRA